MEVNKDVAYKDTLDVSFLINPSPLVVLFPKIKS